MTIQEIINDIINLDLTSIFPASKTIVHKDKQISYSKENHLQFSELIAKAYNYNPDINKTYTLKKFQESFINHFFDNLYSSTKIDKNDSENFVKKLKSNTNQNYKVFRNIFGVNLINPNQILKLGSFKIYHFNTQQKIIESKTIVKPEILWMAGKPNYLIEWEAKARHAEKALEISDEFFRKFELIIRYMMNSVEKEYEVGILNYKGRNNVVSYCFDEKGFMSNQMENKGAIFNVDMDNPQFNSTVHGYDYIWELVGKKQNKFQKRIMLAIEWVGQSMVEFKQSIQNSFIKCAIALEIIFTHDEKSIITPSVINQLSVSIAILLGEDVEDRVEIEKRVKELYGLRSAIVHFGNKDINEADYFGILNIARLVIDKLITNDTLKNITSTEEFHNIIKMKKYSCESF